MQKLRIDFYESGVGETIVITFPSGGLGIVDAHPSKHLHRPDILNLVDGKLIHFICLTHPHEDHGLDLVKVLENHPKIECFWSTFHQTPAFIYGITQTTNFPSEVRDHVAKINQKTGEFFIDMLAAVVTRNIPTHDLRSDLEPHSIDGVEIHCLSPNEEIKNSFFDSYLKRLKDLAGRVPDINLLSAIFAVKYGDSVVLLGADGLIKNWDCALKVFHKRGLPKARVIKVPHHGARNAMDLRQSGKTYLDVCSQTPKAKAIIFAGDSNHPDDDVYQKIKAKTEPICLTNGRKPVGNKQNPLNIQMAGAVHVYPAPVCNPIISLELDEIGDVNVLAGNHCNLSCVA